MQPEADKTVYVQACGPDAFLLLGTGCSDLEPRTGLWDKAGKRSLGTELRILLSLQGGSGSASSVLLVCCLTSILCFSEEEIHSLQ